MVTIATWNVNSIRSRLAHVERYLKEDAPDILLLQELKCEEKSFPFEQIEDAGYNAVVLGQKTYNGVAILSKHPIEDVIKGLPGYEEDPQARYIEGVVTIGENIIRVASVYVPNGQAPDSDKFHYKMQFLTHLHTHVEAQLAYEEYMVIGGDYNIAPENIDVHNPKALAGTICFHPKEQAHYRRLIHLGLTDAYRALEPTTQQFSWWDYRGGSWQQDKGMRIDHLFLSPQAADILVAANVHTDPRGWEKASDHTPVVCDLKIA